MTDLLPTRDMIDDVRTLCENSGRPTTDSHVRMILSTLSPEECSAVWRLSRTNLGVSPLSPSALIDILRGADPEVASAREQSGFYELRAEMTISDQLQLNTTPQQKIQRVAAIAPPIAKEPTKEPAFDVLTESTLFDARPETTQREEITTLVAYHKDLLLVAQAIGISIDQLSIKIDRLGLKRHVRRILDMFTDAELFTPDKSQDSSPSRSIVVRKKAETPRPPVFPTPSFSSPRSTDAISSKEPVNEHGTRVYHRVPLTPPSNPSAPSNPSNPSSPSSPGRREYIREPVVHKKPTSSRSVPAIVVPVQPTKLPFFDLQSNDGRLILEKMLIEEKANPRVWTQKLAEKYDGPFQRAFAEVDLRLLLKNHNLSAQFQERELVNLRFLMGFHHGARGKLMNALLMTPEELDLYLNTLGIMAEFNALRAEKSKIELSKKGIHERIIQVLTRALYLDDLGILSPIDREVEEYLKMLFLQHREESDQGKNSIAELLKLDANPFSKLLKRYELPERILNAHDD